LELLGRSGTTTGAAAALATLEAELARVKPALKALVAPQRRTGTLAR
jgi:hypothetical protein